MFPFSKSSSEAPLSAAAASEPTEPAQGLDALTHGAFSAHTSGERMASLREWLGTDPGVDQLQQVFKELSGKDKGAAKLVRERLDDIKRSRQQASIAQDWADKARALLAQPRLNLADALAWQRDAAKAGAPLSKEPLSELKSQLAERVRAIEDLQHRVQVQREAAVLVAQRIEVLSTKPWREAQSQQEALAHDVAHWQEQAHALTTDVNWPSVEPKFPPQLQASQAQLGLVWEAFGSALAQTVLATQDGAAPLPPVPVWADELRQARGVAPEPAAPVVKVAVDPELRARANISVREALERLEPEVASGHGKATVAAANALRHALKDGGRLIDNALENRAHAVLAAAGELEGWQRWRADQLREELVTKAEALLQRPPGQTIGGRKMQDTLRQLREQWKQTDQGGVPNHALWKRFDDACNEAHKVVQAWLDKIKEEAAQHRAQRLALIDEVKAWAADNRIARDDDWKGFNRVLHEFGERWRASGHVGEKLFAELQPLWKAAIDDAAAPLEAVQKQSLEQRHAMIEQATQLGAEPRLRIDAVKALQQRWQAEAHRVPLDRRHEQKLWDAFRKPIDEAFARKSVEREQAQNALSAHDQQVLQASKALQEANTAGDAQAIRVAMTALEAALRGQVPSQAPAAAPQPPTTPEAAVGEGAAADPGADGQAAAPDTPAETPAAESRAASVPRKPVVAMRGDDRPGHQRQAPATTVPSGRGRPERARADRSERAPRREERFERSAAQVRPATPRLGDAAFRAQREALEQAQLALRKLAAQAHGEALTQLLTAWEQRDAKQLPEATQLGNRVSPAQRAAWAKAVAAAAGGDVTQSMLRLEMAAEVPTPAEHLNARRLLQLQLLTRRNDPSPRDTWTQDTAAVLAAGYDAALARRLQSALKVLLKA